MVSKKAKNIYCWLELITEYDMELSCVNDPKLLKHVKLESISTDTSAKYFHLVVESVQRKFKVKAADSPYRGLMFDMYEDRAGSKLLGVFLILPDPTFKKPEIYLLCLCPLEDETNCSADNQISTINNHLGVIGLDLTKDISFLVVDNTSVNPAIARKVMIPLIGCKSHILALALKKEYLRPYEDLIHKVHVLCSKLRTCKHRGYLRQTNWDLSPFIVNGVRWSSVYTCLKQYVQIHDNINIHHADLIDLVLTAREDSDLDSLLQHLESPAA